MKNYLENLNLFPSTDDDVDEGTKLRNHRTSIITTRIYLIVLIVLLLIISIFFWLNGQTVVITVKNPSQTQFNDLPFDAYCPCSHVSIEYGQFTSIDAIFHQVCSSDFITDRWIRTLYSSDNATYFFILDFRTAGSAQFQALASFCRLVKTSVLESISSFQITSIISPQAISRSIFQSQLNASLQEFQQKAANRFRTQLELVRRMIIGNEMMTQLQTNKRFSYGVDRNSVLQLQITYSSYENSDGTQCDCITNIDCGTSSVISNIFGELNQLVSPSYRQDLMVIPGLKAGCLPVDALLISTLQCFYSQSCIDRLLEFFPNNETFTAMIERSENRFSSTTIVKTIVDNLMVEKWLMNASFDRYYSKCAPIFCRYSINSRSGFTFVLKKLVESLGGLTITLGFILPFLIQKLRAPRTGESVPLSITIRRIMNLLQRLPIELNIFGRENSDERHIRYQRIATRLYLFLLIISTVILAFLSSLIEQIHRDSVKNPTESKYHILEAIYGDRLSCPCTSISMNYESFIAIYPQFHQICSSDFISDAWILYFTTGTTDYPQQSAEYRAKASNYFRLLAMFCENTRRTVDDAVKSFLQTKFISSQVIAQRSFESQIKASIFDWQTNTIESYLRTVELLGAMHYTNRLSSNLFGNWFSIIDDQIQLLIGPWVEIGGCVCGLSRYCRSPFGIYSFSNVTNTSIEVLSIPNFYFGCAPLDGLFQSTLEIVYNRSFLREVDGYMYQPLGDAFNFSTLDRTKNDPYETVHSIINRLMVDTWTSNVSFQNFFNRCAPAVCTFQYVGRNNLFIVIMTIVGVFGGLSLAIKVTLLITLRFIEKMMNDVSYRGLRILIRNLFICPTESQLVNRIHCIILIIVLSIIYVTSSVSRQTVTLQVTQPSLLLYEELTRQYSDSIQCSCSNAAVKYETFLDVVPYFHALCSSSFVSDDWITYLFNDNSSATVNIPLHYLYSLIGQSQVLSSLCQLSQEAVYSFIQQLKTTRLLETSLLSVQVLNERLRSTMNTYQLTSLQQYLSTFDLIRETIGANMILSFFVSNWRAIRDSVVNINATLHTTSAKYDSCDCGLSWQCKSASIGLMLGCYPTETLLQTPIACFYDQQCIDPSGRFPSLNIAALVGSQFNLSTPVRSLIDHLMVEKYSSDISYQKYYNACAPSSCSYSYESYRTSRDIGTSLVSLYGGLVIITRSIAVIVTHAWLSRNHRVDSVITLI